MRIELRDDRRALIGRIEVDPALRPTRVTVVDSDREVFLNWDIAVDDAGNLRRCVACGCTDLFIERAFPRVTGFVVVLAFAGAVVGALGLATTPPVLIAMGVVFVLDVAILLFSRRRLACYRCRSSYHGLPIARYHRSWDRATAERYPLPASAKAPDTDAPLNGAPRPPTTLDPPLSTIAEPGDMTTTRNLLLLGAGGHAAVVAESARAGGWTVLGLLDDDPGAAPAAEPLGLRRLGAIADLEAVLSRHAGAAVHAAAGDPALRRRWLEPAAGATAATVVHPAAIVSPSAQLGEGVFVGPGAIVNARTLLERGVIVNSGAIVEHDCIIGAFAHVAPGAILAGGVDVGAEALVGAGATVRPGVRLGRGCALGAGAVAVSDIPDGASAVGVPARTD